MAADQKPVAQKPVAFMLDTFDADGVLIERDYHSVDEWPFGRTGGVPLYATPPPAQELTDERLWAALADARDAILSWGSYASDYFQKKHDLAGDLAKLDALLEAHHAR